MLETTLVRHVYDIELVSLLKTYAQGIRKVTLDYADKTPEYFIDLIKFQINNYCEGKGITFVEELQIVVTPEEAGPYKVFLGLSLIFYDVHKIRQYLNYHENQFNSCSKSTEEFLNVVEFQVDEILKFSSPFDNSKRLTEVMRWVEDKRIAIKNEITKSAVDAATKESESAIKNVPVPVPSLDWDIQAKPQLLRFSDLLSKRGYTTAPLAFREAIMSGKITTWKANIESWVYLLYRLTRSPYGFLTSQSGKRPYFTVASLVFNFCDDYKKKSKKINFASKLSHVRNPKLIKHRKTRADIDLMLEQVFGTGTVST